jgi:hypothetical protein
MEIRELRRVAFCRRLVKIAKITVNFVLRARTDSTHTSRSFVLSVDI